MWISYLVLTVLVFLSSVAGTRLVLAYLRHRQILDVPNERSSHAFPTPRGGGLAVTPVILLGWAVCLGLDWGGAWGAWLWALVGGGAALFMTSWLDDRFSLPPAPRFAVHALVVGLALALLPPQALVFQDVLPLWADRLITALGWIWFVNLYNFMDGIDGITGMESADISFGIILIALVMGLEGMIPLGLVILAAAMGFLVWNWHPAKLFLGDAGSIPLGYLLGGLLLLLAVQGNLTAALILPAYYLADATITLGRRALKREKIWQAHRQHFYQRAVQGGVRHDQVVLAIAVGNTGLIIAAVLAGFWALPLAVLMVSAMLIILHRWSRGDAR